VQTSTNHMTVHKQQLSRLQATLVIQTANTYHKTRVNAISL